MFGAKDRGCFEIGGIFDTFTEIYGQSPHSCHQRHGDHVAEKGIENGKRVETIPILSELPFFCDSHIVEVTVSYLPFAPLQLLFHNVRQIMLQRKSLHSHRSHTNPRNHIQYSKSVEKCQQISFPKPSLLYSEAVRLPK